MDIQQRIQALSKELQIFIYEFNPEHRYFTKELHRELNRIIYPPCRVCLMPFKNEFCGLDYFIIRNYKIYGHWCDINCFDKDTDTQTKVKCLKAVDQYMKERKN